MTNDTPARKTTVDEWIENEALPFALDSSPQFNAAVDKMTKKFGDKVQLLGFGEALHGAEELLILRNYLFQRLVEAFGFSAIGIESNFTAGTLINDYILGRGAASYNAVRDTGITHTFGKFEANRELVEWMRQYNADPNHATKLHFYGFDSPTDATGTDSPRQSLKFTLSYLDSVDKANGQEFRERLEPLIGNDADWENPAAIMDPSKAIGQSERARALRIETEELLAHLQTRRPDYLAKSDKTSYREAVQFAVEARQLLHYHAVLAQPSTDRQAKLLGIRDAIMADNLDYIVSREQGRGKVMVFAHNNHLKRAKVEWQWGTETIVWWPAGAHLSAMFGEKYAVIGSAIGESSANGIAQPEAGSLEARLATSPGASLFLPTHLGQGLNTEEISALPVRTTGTKNRSYMDALNLQSFSDFDGLAFLDSLTYARGWPPLEEWGVKTEE